MKIVEPFECIINRNKTFALFKTEDDRYLLFNGVQTIDFDNQYIEDYIILTNEDVIPFVLVHNMRIDTTINILENNNKYGRNQLLNIVKNSRIENELNTNLTVDDIYNEYDNSIITYDELYLWLILDTQRKYHK